MPTPVPFTREELNQTIARDKSRIKIFTTYGGYTQDPNDPLALPSLSGLTLVGDVTKVEIKNPRSGTERRELNYDTYAEILEMIPGLSSFELSFHYIVLYRSTLPEALGVGNYGVRWNTRPFLFSFLLPSPNPSTLPAVNLLARGCWLGDNPEDFGVEEKDDLRIIQEVPFLCAGIQSISA